MKILNPIQEKILDLLQNIEDIENFCLSGGTALSAFYLFHRKSNDLDFFTSVEELIVPFSFLVEKKLNKKNFFVERKRQYKSFVELYISDRKESTILHIALDSPFKLEEPRNFNSFPSLKVDSFADISANKMLALFGRAELRDFIDVYFIVKERKLTKEKIIDISKKKDPGFDLYWLAVAFERVNRFPENAPDLLLMVKKCSMKELREFFNNWKLELKEKLGI